MSPQNWLRSWLRPSDRTAATKTPTAKGTSLRARPAVTCLEDRVTPNAGDLLQTRQFGDAGDNQIIGTAGFGDVIYATGPTGNSGAWDSFLRRYDATGDIAWEVPITGSGNDYAYSVAATADAVYVAGYTDTPNFAPLVPGDTAGGGDAFLRKYDTSGQLLWSRLMGNTQYQGAYAVTADGTGVYVGGETDGAMPGGSTVGGIDGWARKFDFDGNVLWTNQFGTPNGHDSVFALTLHETGLYAVGRGNASGAFDSFVWKRDSATGGGIWASEFGSTSGTDNARNAVVDATGVYVFGDTTGALNLPGVTAVGGRDAYLRKYDHNGTPQWVRQFGTPANEAVDGGMVLSGGTIYLTLDTDGAFHGSTNAGQTDLAAFAFDTAGNEIWTRQYGTTGYDHARSLVVNDSGVHIGGYTSGSFACSSPSAPPPAMAISCGSDSTERPATTPPRQWPPTAATSTRRGRRTAPCPVRPMLARKTPSCGSTMPLATSSGPASSAPPRTMRRMAWRSTPPASMPSATRPEVWPARTQAVLTPSSGSTTPTATCSGPSSSAPRRMIRPCRSRSMTPASTSSWVPPATRPGRTPAAGMS